MATALVIENDPKDDLRRLGEWLTEAGLDLHVLRPYAGDALPGELTGFEALIVLGGRQQAYPLPDGSPDAPWFPALEGLLRKAVRHHLPTLAVCLGAQLLATAHAGTVALSEAGPEVGPGVVGKRDAADGDPLFKWVPLIPDVVQWHQDEITELPRGAVLLAASTRYPHQAFRLGDRAWALQFHIEADTAMVAGWAEDPTLLDQLGYDRDAVIAAADAVMADVEEVWQPFAVRFAALAQGELDVPSPRRDLPLLGPQEPR
ncbi:type 1 glutamine amidotransferase [Micromonospora sp. NPDC050397]|uniref:type 1 glutamine amidotransferase n=1 Tax=Micromonospora sp. NPDC050397 TaxID=3364279 RepID=UPI00385177A1